MQAFAIRAAVLMAWPVIYHLEGFVRGRLRRRSPGAAAVLFDKFDAGQLKRLSEHRKGRLPRFRCFALKYPDRSHSDTGSVRELLLSPVKEASGRSAPRQPGPQTALRGSTGSAFD
jgi:hypothetical protein